MNNILWMVFASGWTTLDDEVAGWLLLGGQHFQPGLMRKIPNLGYGAALASHEHHLDGQTSGRVVRTHPFEDHNSTGGARRFGAACQDRSRFRVGPVVQNPPQQIEVRACRQWVEETLPDRRDALGYAGGLERLAGEGYSPR